MPSSFSLFHQEETHCPSPPAQDGNFYTSREEEISFLIFFLTTLVDIQAIDSERRSVHRNAPFR